MDSSSLQSLVVEAEQLQRKYDRDLLSLLDRIEKADPDLVRRTLETFADGLKAARWLTMPQPQLKGLSPLQAAAQGRKADVIAILGRIDQGTFA